MAIASAAPMSALTPLSDAIVDTLPSRVSEISALEDAGAALNAECAELAWQIAETRRRTREARRKYCGASVSIDETFGEQRVVLDNRLHQDVPPTTLELSQSSPSIPASTFEVIRTSASWKAVRIPASPVPVPVSPLVPASSTASVVSFFSSLRKAISLASLTQSASNRSVFRGFGASSFKLRPETVAEELDDAEIQSWASQGRVSQRHDVKPSGT